MDEQVYGLLTTVLGASIPGIFSIAKEFFMNPKPPINQKRRQSMLLIIILICVGAGIGFYIGNATKRSPSIVKHYNPGNRNTISMEKIAEIELKIHEMKHVRALILGQANLPEQEKEEKINNINNNIRGLEIEIQEYEAILRGQ